MPYILLAETIFQLSHLFYLFMAAHLNFKWVIDIFHIFY